MNCWLTDRTRGHRFKKWFVDNINWCEGEYYGESDESGNPIAKPENKIYNWFYEHWLWPWEQNDCVCCNTVRGIAYGIIIGFIAGVLV